MVLHAHDAGLGVAVGLGRLGSHRGVDVASGENVRRHDEFADVYIFEKFGNRIAVFV